MALALLAGAVSGSAQHTAAVRGVVRNSDGVPQMGVVVELLGADASVVANAFTDLNGRFALPHISPGTYQVRATGALYLPALRQRLRLNAGERSTVNLMLSGLFEQAWPDRVSRHTDLTDDWRWTLRSSANRPLLRVFEEDGGPTIAPREGGSPRRSAHATAAFAGGSFGESGALASFDLQQVAASESSTSFIRLSSLQRGNGPSGVDAAVGMERHSAQGLVRKAAARVLSRPGVSLDANSSELIVADAEAGERLPLGDIGELESGALLRTYHLGETTVAASHPFLRLTATPDSRWDLIYSLAGDPECQGLDDIGDAPSRPINAGGSGRSLLPERGLHQAISVRRRAGRLVASATVSRDTWNTVVLAAVPRAAASLQTASAVQGLTDPVSRVTLLGRSGFSGQGWLLALSFPLGADTAVSLDGGEDVALGARGDSRSVAPASNSLAPVHAPFVRASMQGRLGRTATRVQASYAWQPGGLVTVVAPYAHAGDDAYLSIHIRQPLRTRGVLHDGTVLTLDASNLLRQGYVAVASADAGLLTLASTLQTVQGGLAFTF